MTASVRRSPSGSPTTSRVTPADFVAAVRRTGLERLANGGPVDGDRPTLRQMVESGRGVLFLAENRAGGAP
jgi:hypothetical protein